MGRATAVEADRRWFESMVADTAFRPRSPDAIRTQLRRQIAFQPEPTDEGLDELAMLLARWFGGEHELEAVAGLSAAYPAQPVVHFDALAMQAAAGLTLTRREALPWPA